ncbi:UvrD-helicase domain-containing protein [Fervidobacterium gondwanense]|uniref:UvrD-helicase domain-containing protein n=1 Tax=Fervidobacterium gondwanense TaxID=44754 RepID=UPI003A606E07
MEILQNQQNRSVAEIVRQNPNCNYFISASAGTGKTYTLTNYYIGILEHYEQEGKSDIVDSIVAVTFTNKAANEMKDRIMKEIQKKLTAVDPNSKEYRYWNEVYRNMSRAIISTIDSFCRRVLIEQNVEAGVDPNFKIINELKMLRIVDKATQKAIQIAFEVYDLKDGERIADKLSPFLYGLTTERRERIEELVKDLAESKDDIFHLFNIFGDVFKVKEKIEEVVRSWRLELNDSKVSERLLEVFEEAGGALRAFRNIALIAAEFYESETIENFEYDFKGVLEKTLKVLEKPSIREYYQKRFKYIIVDEFQDTNDLQERIFDLIHTDENYIFYVGDRKQSIYRFRGGDVSVFVKTMNKFEKKIKDGNGKYSILSLKTNYRSHPELVDYFNYISENVIFNNVIYEGLATNKNTNKNSKENEEEKIFVHEVFRLKYPDLYNKLWFIESDDKSSSAFLPDPNENVPDGVKRVNYIKVNAASDEEKKNEREIEALSVAKMIKALVGKEMTFYEKQDGKHVPVVRKITYKDFAILSYKLQEVEDVYREVFAREGIPLYIVKGRGFYRRPEIRAVISALDVIQNPNNNYHFVQIFLSPFFEEISENSVNADNSSDERLKMLNRITQRYRESAQSGIKKSFFQCAKDLRNEGALPHHICQMLDLIEKYDELKYYLKPAETLKLFIKESEYLRKLAQYPNSSQRLRNVRKLLEQASDFNDQAPTFLELTRLLEKISEIQEVEASEISEEEDVVRMMTVHASKGLEFNIVFLVNNDYGDRNEEKTLFPYSENEIESVRYIYISQFLDKVIEKFGNGKLTAELEKELRKILEAEIIYDETEILRKVYVAITRAKEMLFVLDLQKKKSDNKKGTPAIKYLDYKGYEENVKVIENISEIEKLIGEIVGSDEEVHLEQAEASAEEIESKFNKELIETDFTQTAYKRYISPTIIYNLRDEKSDLEAINELEQDFEVSEGISFASAGAYQNYEGRGSMARLEALNELLERSSEINIGKKVHSILTSVNKYEHIKALVERGSIPEQILNVHILEPLFNENEKILSEWRIAKHIEIDGKSYVLFGVPDKVFLKNGEFYVVDFKSADLYGNSDAIERYKFQLKFYMYLLSDIGKVHCGYLVSVPRGQALRIDPPDERFFDKIVEKIESFEEMMKI